MDNKSIKSLKILTILCNAESFSDLRTVFWRLFGRSDDNLSVKCKSQHKWKCLVTFNFLKKWPLLGKN